MLGSYPIAGAPLAAGPNANPAVTSQSISLTLSSVSVAAAANPSITSQSLSLTENSITYASGVEVTLASQSLTVYPPGSVIYDAAIASTPICGIPTAYPISGTVTVSGDANTALASQTLNLTENSIYNSDDDNIEIAGQVLELTENSVVVTTAVDITLASQTLTFTENSATIEVQPPAFDSQYLNLTENSISLSVDQVLTVDSQSLALTENSVSLSTNNQIDITAETPLALTLRSVGLSLDAVLTPTAQYLTLSENPVSLITDQTIEAGSQTIYTTLNGLRLWKIISTLQPGNCPDHCDGLWTEIAYDQLVYGDDFAIAAEPIGSLPQGLPPIRKFPGTPWAGVTTQTTTTWSNIQT